MATTIMGFYRGYTFTHICFKFLSHTHTVQFSLRVLLRGVKGEGWGLPVGGGD